MLIGVESNVNRLAASNGDPMFYEPRNEADATKVVASH